MDIDNQAIVKVERIDEMERKVSDVKKKYNHEYKYVIVVTPGLLHFAIFCQVFEIRPHCYTFSTLFCNSPLTKL